MKKFVYFEGGLGDLINNFYATDQYDFLQSEEVETGVGIVLACHSPFAHEFFSYSKFAHHYDIRLAGHHFAFAQHMKFDAMQRKEHICEAAGVHFEFLRRVRSRASSAPIELPNLGTIPIVNKELHNILIVLDAAIDWKSIPFHIFYDVILGYIRDNPDKQFYLISRRYRKLFKDDAHWFGFNPDKIPYFFNLNIVSPTVPDTLSLARQCDLIITPHSCLAQFAAHENLPCIVAYPQGWNEFQLPKYGNGHTKHFGKPNFQLLPFSLFQKETFSEAISKGLTKPF